MKPNGGHCRVCDAEKCTDEQQTLSRKNRGITVGNRYRSTKCYEDRGAWVLTAYTISGLALFGVLAYFFSNFIAR